MNRDSGPSSSSSSTLSPSASPLPLISKEESRTLHPLGGFMVTTSTPNKIDGESDNRNESLTCSADEIATSDYDFKEEEKKPTKFAVIFDNYHDVDADDEEEKDHSSPTPLTTIPEEEEEDETSASSRKQSVVKVTKMDQGSRPLSRKEKFLKDRHPRAQSLPVVTRLESIEGNALELGKHNRSQSCATNVSQPLPSKWSTFDQGRQRSMRRRKSSKKSFSTDERRKSIINTFLGDAHYRRYSADLIPSRRISRRIGGAGSGVPPVITETTSEQVPVIEPEETSRVIFFQVFIPFLIAGFDNVGAGFILDTVQHWEVFRTIPELFILVASFLGLKGNLEMTLAARLATSANLGHLDRSSPHSTIMSIAVGNLVLVQGQAIAVAFLASIIAIFVNYFKEPDFDTIHCIILFLTSLTTASITGFAMASLMFLATVFARRIGVNPDNVSALIASIMGDISAVSLLAFMANLFYNSRELLSIYGYFLIAAYACALPVILYMALKFKHTREVVGSGWIPIISALMISSLAGFVFDVAVGAFDSIAVVQPIINGVGGNLIAIQASRISTYFHLRVPLGELPADDDEEGNSSTDDESDLRKEVSPSSSPDRLVSISIPESITPNSSNRESLKGRGVYSSRCPSPIDAFVGSHTNVKTARLLLLMSIPIHAVYLTTVCLLKKDQMSRLTISFGASYILVVVAQISSLLYAAHIMVPFLWKKSIDPDNAAVPALMSLADLLGTCFLTFIYVLLRAAGDDYVDYTLHSTEVSMGLIHS